MSTDALELCLQSNPLATAPQNPSIFSHPPRCGFAPVLRMILGAYRTMPAVWAHMANFDNGGSRSISQASVKGTVKWFNSTKGYGFITLESGSDAFCHASALAAIGTPDMPTGSTVVCDLQDSPRGLQVVAVHSVDTSTAEASPPPQRRQRGGFG